LFQNNFISPCNHGITKCTHIGGLPLAERQCWSIFYTT